MEEGYEPDPAKPARLSEARADFVENLPRRLEGLRIALLALEQAPEVRARRDNLLRRLHAVGSAAKVLGFASAAERLSGAERLLSSAGREGIAESSLKEVWGVLQLLPTLVHGGPPSDKPERHPQTAWPVCVLVFGNEQLAEQLGQGAAGPPIEWVHCRSLHEARELAQNLGPDVALVDVDLEDGRLLIQELLNDTLIEPLSVVALGDFTHPEQAPEISALGVERVIARPASVELLRRTVVEVRRVGVTLLSQPVGEVTVAALTERLTSELQHGLLEALDSTSRQARIDFGEGAEVLAAVWSAVARVRQLVTSRSEGKIRFPSSGPEGAVPLASGEAASTSQQPSTSLRPPAGVLRGRRVVVADDDPAVVWFLSGVLKSAGALVREAHDGARALELVFSEWPDLVISDVLMPKLDGFSLCREIKRDVAVRDVPVILLSWKEDLLQRLRELGADADAYLEKEVPAPSLMRRLEEVMRPRARVEARLGAGREVSGRLDGLTPRLILELTSALQSDARVSIRDAAYSYTVQIRGGRPRSVIRTAADGTIERGDRVLTGLLGASAGRFTVTPDTSPCAAEFEGTLGQLLAEPIARVRRVQKQLSSPSLSCVVGVQIDEASIARYRASTPEPIEGLLGRLIQGASPRDLLLSGAVQPRLLETVLMDVARHGAVIGVQTIKPSEVDREAPVEAPQKPSTKLSAVTPPIASPLPSGDQPVNTQSVEIKESAFGFEMPSRPPEVKARTAQENDWSGLMDGVEVEPQKPERPVSPESAEPPSDGWDVGEPATIPGVGKAAAPSPAQPKAEQTVAAPEKDIQTKEPAPPKPPPAPTRPAPSPAAPPRPATRTPSPARPQAVHLAQGVLGLEEPLGTVNATPSPPARKARPEPVPPKPPPLVNAGQKISSVPLSPITATLIDARVGPVEAPRAAPPAAPNPPTRSKAPPSPAQPPSAQPKTSPPPAQAAAPPAPPAPSESPLAVETEGSPKTKASLERMPTVLQTEPATELESSPATPVVSVDRTDAVGLASPRRRHSSPWALLLWASAAAVASFGVVRLVVLPAVIRSGQPAAERQSPEHTASAPDPAPSNQVASAPRQEKLPVPPDVDLPAGLGLLEIVSDGKLGIFVDGGFVGAGSLKRLYLAPGSHEVKVRSESAERSSSAMVEVGLRTRLTFEPGEPALAR